MKKPFVPLVAVVLGTALLAACAPTPTPTACAPDALVAPENFPPYRAEIVDRQPTLSWTYPDPSCNPESFQIELARDADFTDLILSDTISGAARSWLTPAPLDAGTRVHWRVRAISGGVIGPGFGNYFITGPLCPATALGALTLQAPADGARYNPASEFFYFEFPMGTCAPQGVLIEIASDPLFSSIVTSLDLPLPYEGVRLTWTWTECQVYYWRARPLSASGEVGPASETRSFLADSTGTCSAHATPCDPATLVEPNMAPPYRGEVKDQPVTLHWSYADLTCQPDAYLVELATDPEFAAMVASVSLPGNTNTWSPPAALAAGTRHYWKVRAIAGTTTGPGFSNYFTTGPLCKPSALRVPTLVSPADGAHYNPAADAFYLDFPAGVCAANGYRLQIATDAAFTSIVTELSVPLPYEGVRPTWTWTECQTYYWRASGYADDGSSGPFSEVRSFIADSSGTCGRSGAKFLVREPANCRSGPGGVYDIRSSFAAGNRLPIIGRNPDASWFLIEQEGLRCWIAAKTGEVEGDAASIPQAEIPPTPTPVYIPPTATPEPTPQLNCGQYQFPNCPPPCVGNQNTMTCTNP